MSDPKFVADAMLGSLARKLRIFGFDTIYFSEGPDDALMTVAKREHRIVLTSDRALHKRTLGARLEAIFVEGKTDRARLISIRRSAAGGITFTLGAGRVSRCAVCNGELLLIAKREAGAEGVPPKALARHRIFFRCASCSRSYWRGSHWERLRRLSYSLASKDLT